VLTIQSIRIKILMQIFRFIYCILPLSKHMSINCYDFYSFCTNINILLVHILLSQSIWTVLSVNIKCYLKALKLRRADSHDFWNHILTIHCHWTIAGINTRIFFSVVYGIFLSNPTAISYQIASIILWIWVDFRLGKFNNKLRINLCHRTNFDILYNPFLKQYI